MINLNDLNDALSDLADAVKKENFEEEIIGSIAHEYNIKIEILQRKFTEKFGIPPKQYHENYLEDLRQKLRSKAEKFGITDTRINWVRLAQSYLNEAESSEKNYRVFTKNFDEVVLAEELCDQKLLEKLDLALSKIKNTNREHLQRYLSEEDSFFQKKSLSTDVAISILVDNSGSMRGNRIAQVASSVKYFAELLAKSNIPFEVSGFTTKTWKGGKSRELWVQAGRPAWPGRLNDLRIISFKDFDASSQTTLKNYSALLYESLLKENIDGEALEFAYKMLKRRAEKKKFLFVISDGAPVDDSTLSVNPADFLEKHLKVKISEIEGDPSIFLVGFGIECDVSRYYSDACHVSSPENLFTELVEKLRCLI